MLPLPPDWELRHVADRRIAIVPGYADAPDLLVLVGPMTLLADDQQAWIDRTLRQEMPENGRLQLGDSRDEQTATGWPMRLIDCSVVAAATGAPIERRLCAFYAFLEHAATAMVRARSAHRFEQHREQLVELLRRAAPDWRGAPAAIAEVWDLEPARPAGTGGRAIATPADERAAQILRQAGAAGEDEAELLAALGVATKAVDRHPRAAELRWARGQILAALDRADEALSAMRQAIELEPGHAGAHFAAATLLAKLGDTEGAIEHWEAAAAARPGFTAASYNAGQAHYLRGEYEAAVRCWEQVRAADPDDFAVLRKLVQALHALQRFDAADVTRAQLVKRWRESSDPRTRMVDEIVIDQFDVGNARVMACETLRPPPGPTPAIYSFRTFDAGGRRLPVTVCVETSDYARERGTPYVLCVITGTGYKVVDTSAELPRYRELKAAASTLIARALGSQN